MATKKYLDNNGLLYFWSQLKTLFAGKVDKIAGKGLSTNDYTTAEQTKLGGIATGATANAAYTSNPGMDGTAAPGSAAEFARGDHVHPTDTSRAPLASPTFTGVPAAPTAAAGTDTTQIASTAFVKAAITAALAGVTGFSFEVVASLPGTGVSGKLYLVSNSGSGQNLYDEYIWTGAAYEKLGTLAIDLSGYQLASELVAVTNAEIDTVLAS